MERRETTGKETRKTALCGLLGALGATVMLLGAWIPATTYCCPILASLVLLPALDFCGRRRAVGVYVVVALLSLLLSPDKEAALLFLTLGYYPILQPAFDRLPRLLRPVCRLLLFAAAAALVYGVLAGLLGLPAESMPPLLNLLVMAAGMAVFFLYDRLLHPMAALCRRRLRPRLERWLQS